MVSRRGAGLTSTPMTREVGLPKAVQTTEGILKDLKADWRKWTRVEKTIAVLIAAWTGSTVPALLLLGQ
jgi:hypothetical protein